MPKGIAHITTTVAAAALAAACGGRSASVAGGGDRGNPQRVKLEGCVQAAPGNRQYVLQNVVTPGVPEQPTANESMPQGRLVPDGSWVRLTPGGEDLEAYLGKRVEVEGTVNDTGASTMGTSGGADDRTKLRRSAPDASSTTDRSLPPSTVLPRGATANGFAPLIAVEQIKKLDDACKVEQERAREGNTGLGKRRRAPKEDNPGSGSHR